MNHRQTFTTPHGAMNVRIDGAATGRPPFLLVHAFAGSLRAWDLLVPQLLPHRQVLRIDLLGHGDSDKPATGYSMPEQAAAICAVLDELGIEKVIAVGHSGGGDVVVAMIEHHPERITKAALIGTPPNLTYVNLPLTARLISAPLLGRILWTAMTDRMLRDGLAKTFAPEFSPPEHVYELLIADIRKMTHESYVKARAEVEGYRQARDLTDRVAGAGIPLLIAFGDQDQWVDPDAAAAWSHVAEIRILPDSGHTPIIEAPDETAQAILNLNNASLSQTPVNTNTSQNHM